MSARTLSRIKIGLNPNTGRIALYRHGSNPQLALEEIDVSTDVIMCFVGMMVHGTDKGRQQNIKIGGNWYHIAVIPIEPPTPNPIPMEGVTPDATIPEKPADAEVPQNP